jgi:hypothetical protein
LKHVDLASSIHLILTLSFESLLCGSGKAWCKSYLPVICSLFDGYILVQRVLISRIKPQQAATTAHLFKRPSFQKHIGLNHLGLAFESLFLVIISGCFVSLTRPNNTT